MTGQGDPTHIFIMSGVDPADLEALVRRLPTYKQLRVISVSADVRLRIINLETGEEVVECSDESHRLFERYTIQSPEV